MLEFAILKPEGIVVLEPDASLTNEDIVGLSAFVDAYLADHASLHGLLIHAGGPPSTSQ